MQNISNCRVLEIEMSSRFRATTNRRQSFQSRFATRSVIFVHGLGGSNGEGYWGKIGQFLDAHSSLTDCDFHFWRYPTTKALQPGWLSLVRGSRLPEIEVIARNLATEIRNLQQKKKTSVHLIGHSLGGVISLCFIRSHMALLDEFSFSQVTVLGSPFYAPIIARAYTIMLWRSNVQIHGLSRTKYLSSLMFEGLDYCRAKGIRSVYVESNQDAIVRHRDAYLAFEKRETVDGPHHWMPDVQNSEHDGYATLARLIQFA